jgi:dienelactone hydrolase
MLMIVGDLFVTRERRPRLHFLTLIVSVLLVSLASPQRGSADPAAAASVQEELWALSLPIPMLAYVARPPGDGPFPLVVMNHGESSDARARGFFPKVEFLAAAHWFARMGYLVVSPIRPGFGSTAIDLPESGIHGIYFGDIGKCPDVDFRNPGIAIASNDQWVIDYMVKSGIALPNGVIVVGQSGGGWGAIALSSKNPATVRAIISFAGGRGGRVDGRPNNNCAPEKLVETAGTFGRTARIPTLWIYVENDSYFGPALSEQMFNAYKAAGGNAEYHLLPAFGDDGHFFVDSADAIPIWEPLVKQFLDAHR